MKQTHPPAEPLFRPTAIRFEISTACNHRCVYCPVSKNQVRQRFMSFKLFDHTLDLISGYIRTQKKKFQRVQFNHYNEPVLDRRLPSFIARAMESGLFESVLLNTNLSVLSKELLERLDPYKSMVLWNVNMPTGDREKYAILHGRDEFEVVEKNIEQLVTSGFGVCINCQVNKWVSKTDVDSVRQRFGKKGVSVEEVASRNRAGASPEIKQVYHHGRIIGCRLDRPRKVISIGVEGEVYLCCDDFKKESTFTNVMEHHEYTTLFDAISSACEPVYGVTPAGRDHICRRCDDALVAA
jgi:hypothetical protein